MNTFTVQIQDFKIFRKDLLLQVNHSTILENDFKVIL
jgi:hypothetical protein